MTPRSIRRAAERKANKLARKAAQQISASSPAIEFPQFSSQDAAPEASAKLATPFIPPAAAANTCLTAATSCLTGQVTLLPKADAAEYEYLLRVYQDEYQPVGIHESQLVQVMAEALWRSRRLSALETGIFAKGHIEFAEQFAEHGADLRHSLINVHIFLTYEKQIRGLQMQEARLARRADKARIELKALQDERARLERIEQRKQEELRQQTQQASHPQPAPPKEIGFVFSNHENQPVKPLDRAFHPPVNYADAA